MNNLKDIKHDDLIRIFKMIKEYREYLDVEKNKLDEIENEKKKGTETKGAKK